MKESPFKYTNSGAMVHRRLFYIYLLNVPSFSSRYFNKIKLTSRLGRFLALSLEILCNFRLDLPITESTHFNIDFLINRQFDWLTQYRFPSHLDINEFRLALIRVDSRF